MARKNALAVASQSEARAARYGERMIEVRVRFFTDEIASTKGEIIPKHAWARGMVSLERNGSQAIAPTKELPFNSILELPAIVERVLAANGIKLIVSPKMKKYMLSAAPQGTKA